MQRTKIIANIATFPPRKTTFDKALLSILPQVDHVNVYLNNYRSVPAILKNEKITAVLSAETKGDLRDNGKFYFLDHVPDDAYYMTIDDDIVYPDDYAATLIKKLQTYDNRVAVGVHGVMFHADFQSFRTSHTPFFFTQALRNDVFGATLGTGTVAFYKKTFAGLTLQHFETTGATDLWFAGYCKEHKIPQVCIARGEGWLQDIKHLFPVGMFTLWRSTEKTEKVQNDIVMRYRLWEVDATALVAYRASLEQQYRASQQIILQRDNERRVLEDALSATRSATDARIRALEAECDALRHSTSFRLGNLFFRSVKRPYKLLTFPINAVGMLVRQSAPHAVAAHDERQKFWCPFCRQFTVFGDAGAPARPYAACTQCGSLERHRWLFYVYHLLFLHTQHDMHVLHMSPEKTLHDVLVAQDNIRYVAADAAPEGFAFTDCRKEDFCHMRFSDKQFDVILANHVMEHIPDEQRCLAEMRRCLTDDGLIILTIPYQVGMPKTFEDATITSEEDRTKYFSQKDHVRLYGEDAAARFARAGFIVQRMEENICEEDFVQTRRLRVINANGLHNGGCFVLRKRCVPRKRDVSVD